MEARRYAVKSDGTRCRVQDLRIGDVATLFEPDGEPCDGGQTFRVTKDPEEQPNGTWVIETENTK